MPIGFDLPSDQDLEALFPNLLDSIIDATPIPLSVWECEATIEMTAEYGLHLNPLHVHMLRAIECGTNIPHEIIRVASPVPRSAIELHMWDLITRRLVTQVSGTIKLTDLGIAFLAEQKLTQSAGLTTVEISIADGNAFSTVTFEEESRRRAHQLWAPTANPPTLDPTNLIFNGNFNSDLIRKARKSPGSKIKRSRIRRVLEVRKQQIYIRGWQVTTSEGSGEKVHVIFRSNGKLKKWPGDPWTPGHQFTPMRLDTEFVRDCHSYISLPPITEDPLAQEALDSETQVDPIASGKFGLTALRLLGLAFKNHSKEVVDVHRLERSPNGEIKSTKVPQSDFQMEDSAPDRLYEYRFTQVAVLSNVSPSRIFYPGIATLRLTPFSAYL